MAKFVRRSGKFAIGDESVQLFTSGNVSVITGTTRWYPPSDITVESITLRTGTAPTSTLTIVARKSGTIVDTITLPSGQNKIVSTVPFDLTVDDYITVDVTTASGKDMTVMFNYTKK